MCRFCLFNPSAFYVNGVLDPGADGGAGLGHQGPVQLLACLIMELIRAAFVL
ncbi:Hypothetical protein FKW44_014168 [Caligus rogercresseyi]|uniref:Uncharacterized protein n=1 Tax=Caligus rogercresseyi TaxID=217165 RepID=A0A7T8JZJ0_CALRO|nr:Hypothetical protein FKW44_014168 [Caligus rogercresseyi]